MKGRENGIHQPKVHKDEIKMLQIRQNQPGKKTNFRLASTIGSKVTEDVN